jgi:hypothetical protein
MILQDPPVENPCFYSRSFRLSSSQIGDIEASNNGGFPTGYAGCGKPLFEDKCLGGPGNLRMRNEQRVIRPVENPSFGTMLLGLWNAPDRPSPVSQRQRVSHSPCFNTKVLGDDY